MVGANIGMIGSAATGRISGLNKPSFA